MAMRLFGFRQPRQEREDSANIAADIQPVPSVKVVGSRLDSESELSISEPGYDGGDPYNTTGRFLAEKLRGRRDD